MKKWSRLLSVKPTNTGSDIDELVKVRASISKVEQDKLDRSFDDAIQNEIDLQILKELGLN